MSTVSTGGTVSRWTGVVVPWAPLAGTTWEGRAARLLHEAGFGADGDEGLVLLDERCPGLSADDVRRVVAAAVQGAVVVGVRPVTDTVKRLQDAYVGPNVDRDDLVAVCSPVVVPTDLVGSLGPTEDLPALVARLVDDGVPLVHVEVPVAGRRLAGVDELVLLG